MNIHRALAREYRLQLNMKKHLERYRVHASFSVPERVVVSLETLLDIKRQLEEHGISEVPTGHRNLN